MNKLRNMKRCHAMGIMELISCYGYEYLNDYCNAESMPVLSVRHKCPYGKEDQWEKLECCTFQLHKQLNWMHTHKR